MTKPINRDQIELSGMPAPEPRMTPKQLKFTRAYLTHFNGKLAATQAGYSERTASSMAYENLNKPHIQKYIKGYLKLYALSTEEICAKLGSMARGEIPTKTVSKNGEVQHFFEEQSALESLAKVHGLFVDRHTIERIDGLQIVDVDDDVPVTLMDPQLLTDDD